MSDLHQFNPGRKSWKMYSKELTSISGDDLTITPYDGQNLILEVSGNGNILFKEDGITYSLADLSNAASSNVNLTNYDDASFGNVDISGIINFFATDEQLLGPDTGIAQKVQDLSNNLIISHATSTSLYVGAGSGISSTGDANTFLGIYSGYNNESGYDNTFLGYYSGYSSTGSQNTFLGHKSGYNNTADYNVFIGWYSGFSNTTGSLNTFIGSNCGRYNVIGGYNAFFGINSGHQTTASYNTMIGINSGYNNESGHDNTFLGSHSGHWSTGSKNTFLGANSGWHNTADNNTLVGYSSGNSNTSGYNNTFVGFNSGQSNTTGDNNTFIGLQAGRFNGLGSNNTFVGLNSGQSNTIGGWNTFIGLQAGYSNGSGANNTFVGLNSGFYSIDSSNNTFLGSNAGFHNRAGTNNIAIGYNAQFKQDPGGTLGVHNTSDNEIVIGTSAIGNGSNTITLGTTSSTQLYVPGLQAGAATGDVLTFDGTKIALATPSAGGSTFTNLTATGSIFTNTIDRYGSVNLQRLGNNGTAYIDIDHNGHVYGGATAASWYGGHNGANLFGGGASFRARGGQCQASHNLTITSDDRFKSRTVNLPDNCLDIINKLQPKKYLKHHGHYVPEGVEDSDLSGVDTKDEAGLISQDVEKIPELNWLITEQELDIDTKKYYKAIDYGSLYPYLIKAVQELNECVKSLEAKVKTLESK
tara:strand:- start:1662 stop:3752 length:2091 start_codon:yes stop_codon:yes gene_type:complete